MCALLLISLLGLAFSAPAHAAAPLDFDYASTTVVQSTNSTSFSSLLTVEISHNAGSPRDYLLIGHANLYPTATAAAARFRLYNVTTSAAYMEVGCIDAACAGVDDPCDCCTGSGSGNCGLGVDGYQFVAVTRGHVFNALRKVSVPSGTAQTFALQFANENGSGSYVSCDNASLVAIEYDSASMAYAERTLNQENCSTTTYTGLSLDVTPASSGDYALLWAAEIMRSDESDTAVQGPRFRNTTGPVTLMYDGSPTTSSTNDDAYFIEGGAAYQNLPASTRTFNIEITGGGSGDDHCIRNAAIAAIRLDRFQNAYKDCNWGSDCTSQTYISATTSRTFVDLGSTGDGVSVTQTVNAAKHLVLAGGEVYNATDSDAGGMQLYADGTLFPGRGMGDKTEGTAGLPAWMYFFVYGNDLVSGSKTFKLQHRTMTGDTGITKTGPAYLMLLEIPPTTTTTTTTTTLPSTTIITTTSTTTTIGATTTTTLCDCCTSALGIMTFETVVPSGTAGTLSSWCCSNSADRACVDAANCDFGICNTELSFCWSGAPPLSDVPCTQDADCVGTCQEQTSGTLPMDLDKGALYIGSGLIGYALPFLIPDKGKSYLEVTSCDTPSGMMQMGATTPMEVGHRYCSKGRSCSTDPMSPCTLDSDCPDSGECIDNCFFGPPIAMPHLSSPMMSICLMNVLDDNMEVSASCFTGVSDAIIPIRSRIYLTGDLLNATYPPDVTGIQPCPLCTYQCVGGSNQDFPCAVDSDCPGSTCDGSYNCMKGLNDGDPCVPETSDSATLGDSQGAYPTSHDCELSPDLDVAAAWGGLPMAFNLTSTSSVVWNASNYQNQKRVFCGYCRDVGNEGGGGGTSCFEGDPDEGCPTATPDLPGAPVPCASDDGCEDGDEYESCTQRNPGAFAEAMGTRISLLGSTDNECMDDGENHPVDLVGLLCVPPTFDALVDNVTDVPGPAAVVLKGNAKLMPEPSPAQTIVIN